MNLGDLMDILALINSGINFILYCSMSKQFRDHFARLFIPYRSGGSTNSSRPAKSGHDSLPTLGPPRSRVVKGRLAALHMGEITSGVSQEGWRGGQSPRSAVGLKEGHGEG